MASGQRHDHGPVEFAHRLEWYRGLTLAALNDTVPATEPQQHLYAPIRTFLERPSNGLRPALCLATCLAYGGRVEDAMPSAAGIEMLHNAFLVHDDIEDGSESRRGQPTLHRELGVPLAVNIGDAMNTLSMGLFRQNVGQLGPERALRIFDEVDHMLRESLEGQALELGWTQDNRCDLDTDDYMRLVLKKTAWYSFIHPMRIGAVSADADINTLDRFHAFGFLLGAAFQIHDDLLNLAGDEAVYGKEIGGDLWEGKRTLPLIYALSTASGDKRAMLVDFAGRRREKRLTRQLVEVQSILRESGGVERTRQVARALATAAERRLTTAFVGAQEGPDLEFVRELLRFIVERNV
ncbi:MAG: polyprenyl synthetase family protein [Actinobacteria bacterium]|nr:polyprenyl synthetase family protein [Actinomycetota bacterium]